MRSVREADNLNCLDNVGSSTFHKSLGLYGRLREYLYFIYIDDIRTSQETYASTALYGDSFTFYI
jgi:hypothetical protein